MATMAMKTTSILFSTFSSSSTTSSKTLILPFSQKTQTPKSKISIHRRRKRTNLLKVQSSLAIEKETHCAFILAYKSIYQECLPAYITKYASKSCSYCGDLELSIELAWKNRLGAIGISLYNVCQHYVAPSESCSYCGDLEMRIELAWKNRDHRHLSVQMDEVLASVDTMYELYDPSTVIFFFRNKLIMIDLGTGNNKVNWELKDKQEFIDMIETVYRGDRKGRGLAIAPEDYSTKYGY